MSVDAKVAIWSFSVQRESDGRCDKFGRETGVTYFGIVVLSQSAKILAHSLCSRGCGLFHPYLYPARTLQSGPVEKRVSATILCH